ncbi:hypothetical protein MPSEU_000633900 [Mayamaea pseudoterrestris]|nr:hypothetical protein MPSEU_000633900 [Mayamaea pseudoterrestris]
MHCYSLILAALFAPFGLASSSSTQTSSSLPNVVPTIWLPASLDLTQIPSTRWTEVTACCRAASTKRDKNGDDDESCPAPDAIDDKTTNSVVLERFNIGRLPQFTKEQSLHVLQDSVEAWKHGAGVWPQMTLQQRIESIQIYLEELSKKREDIVNVLMWEIGKNRVDAEAEFDRTIIFAKSVIQAIQTNSEFTGEWKTHGGTTRAFVKRNAIGVYLTLAPYNYPLNESYACIIPLLLMGNVCILKIPTVGGLVHVLTMEALQKSLPPGTVNFIAGSGRSTMPPLMETGLVDGLAFIGGSKAADELIKLHPQPHRLKIFLQLEANNMAIYLDDMFTTTADAVLNNALNEAITGSLSYNGQRCTALKLHYVPSAHAETFVEALVKRVDAMTVGLPDQMHESNGKYSMITPLPNSGRIDYMKELIDDAVVKGAKVVNANGGKIIGGAKSTLMVPAVLFPVTPNMKVFNEEQFGPIIPITTYSSLEEVINFGQSGQPFGQQVSIFGQDPASTIELVDGFSAVFAKINLNQQCGRSPDTLPFAGRRSSAMGVMSVMDALREFSVPTAVAYKGVKGLNEALVDGLERSSNFMQTVT